MSTFTIENLRTLEEAIASGVRTVKFADKEITYQTLAEMLFLRRKMAKAIGLGPKHKRVKPRFSKGL